MKYKIQYLLSIRFSIVSTLFAAILILIGYFVKINIVRILLVVIYFGGIYYAYSFFYSKFIVKEFKKLKKKVQKEYTAENYEEITKKKSEEIAQLKENEQFRKEFIGNVAHELKTPIFNIQGFTLTLIDGAINDPEVNMKYLERTDKNVQRLIAIVKDLDTISKLETGILVPDFEIFDLREIVLDIFDVLEERAIEFGVKLTSDFSGGSIVYADKEKITEVINNLVLNSIIYGKKDGETQVIVKEKRKRIVVMVKDNGIGISDHNQRHIFERFFRVDKSRSRERGGSGLGLAIVKHIIDSHKQTIEVNSKEGVGTTFTFTLEKAEFNESEKN